VVYVSKVTRENLIPLDKERRAELRKEDAAAFASKEEGYISKIRGDRSEFEAMGGVTYMPLRLAYATTVHKSQGLTLDNVQVSITDRFWETPGMVYVALSRSRTADGLRVVGSRELFMKRITTDPRVREWI
jgi:ATP-dependent exoDNAse (exonuclease V) alpha subunit